VVVGSLIFLVFGGLWWYQIEREHTRIMSFKETSVGHVVWIDFFSTPRGYVNIVLMLDNGDVVYGDLDLYHHVEIGTYVNVTHSMKEIIELKVLAVRVSETKGGTPS